MLWKKKKQGEVNTTSSPPSFEMAKEATRRAVFLNTATRMPGGPNAQEGATLFRVCRSVAISAGAAIGQSEAQVDAAIAAQCDEDVARLKNGSDEEMREFSRESGEIVRAFLATLDERTLLATAKG